MSNYEATDGRIISFDPNKRQRGKKNILAAISCEVLRVAKWKSETLSCGGRRHTATAHEWQKVDVDYALSVVSIIEPDAFEKIEANAGKGWLQLKSYAQIFRFKS